MTNQLVLNIVNSENTVTASQGLGSLFYPRRVQVFSNCLIVQCESATAFLRLDGGLSVLMKFDEIIGFPERDIAAYLSLINPRILIETRDRNSRITGPMLNIIPSFSQDVNIAGFNVFANTRDNDTATLLAMTRLKQLPNNLLLCSQTLNKTDNFKPLVSMLPYCQEIANISDIKKFSIYKALRKEYRSYLTIEYVANSSLQAQVMPLSSDFKLIPNGLFNSNFSVHLKTDRWADEQNSSQKAFVISSRKVSQLVTLLWPEDGIKYRTMHSNSIFVKGIRTPEGALFETQGGMLKNISIFHYPPEFNMRFNFTFIEKKGSIDFSFLLCL